MGWEQEEIEKIYHKKSTFFMNKNAQKNVDNVDKMLTE